MKIYERGTLGWLREQQKKKLDKKNKIIERWERCDIANIFKDKGFNDEDRDDWFQFWSKVYIKDNINECWNWNAYIEESNGYGRTTVKGIDRISVHRLSYILTKGSIPDGLQVQHACNNRLCCNPNHLELGRLNVIDKQKEKIMEVLYLQKIK
jgi:hypothetical protein